MKQARRLLALLEILTAEVLLMGLVFVSSLLAFFYLARVVFVEHSTALDQFGFAKMDALRQHEPGLTAWVGVITFFASLPFLVMVGLIVPALMWWRGLRREATEVFLAVAGASALNQLLKSSFHRVRPSSALLQQMGLSFPSGHSMIGMAFYGCLAWILWRHRQHPLWAVLLMAWSVLIGLTRVYLHVHYTTDVLAGFAAGLFWLILLRMGFHFWWRKEEETRKSVQS
ncbi:phosphatase PAP2 family protein [Hymenobacter sp. BT491]|uniref:phosphatase PAP2 family protein n=1 Tax=Hymenobacter sp. BT491 TaxID=2766779 RepID=UPI00165367FC|nr:phosphatase PAP2 family protein [Hymenobacter sp. BT491]MBC6988475.1 phosphatase PAP2 family protein [Hymenobacter sp. BT491]